MVADDCYSDSGAKIGHAVADEASEVAAQGYCSGWHFKLSWCRILAGIIVA
jgi:hypothetical protein